MNRPITLASLLALTASLAVALPPPDPTNGDITLPDGFGAVVVADDLSGLRFITVSPSGDVFVKTRRSGIIALRDTDGDGRADEKREFGSGGGTGIAWRDGWLYHSTDDDIYRYALPDGTLEPKTDAELIVKGLPNERQHAAKSIAFDGDGRLYSDVGAPSNAGGNPDRVLNAKGVRPSPILERHAGVWRFDAAKPSQDQVRDGHRFSTGSRHILALNWNPVSRAMFVVMMGRDQLNTVAPQFFDAKANSELPAEEMHRLDEGANLGWPYTYWDPMKKARFLAPEYDGDGKKQPEEKYSAPLVAFPAHWAPMQMAFNSGENFPERYHGGAFVAFHGSWNRAPEPQKGYKVVFVPFGPDGMPTGEYETFADGFAGTGEIKSPGDARFRPCGVAFGPDGSLYVSDSQKGRVWRIFHTGK
jgi:glucose/arabinose dehydrogenase